VTAGDDPASHREQLYEAFLDSDADIEEKVQRGLAAGVEYLDVDVGFLTRITADTQEIRQVAGDESIIAPGERCDIEDAYCQRTVDVSGALSIQNATESGEIPDRAVEAFDLGTYIGAKVMVENAVNGTVCFASRDPRDEPFSETAEMFVELLARLVAHAYENHAYEEQLQQRNQRLRAEKDRFQGIAENSFDILFRLDDAGEFTYVSSAGRRVLGYDPDSLVGEPFASILADGATGGADSVFGTLMRGETVEQFELTCVDADGERSVLEINATPVYRGDSVVGVQGVGRDITERKDRERDLRVANRALEDATVGVAIADATEADAPIVYVNDAFERITGYDAGDAEGRSWAFLLGETTEAGVVSDIYDRIGSGESVTVELVAYRKDGSPFWNDLSLSPVRGEDGSISHIVGFHTDVTERKRTERLVSLLNRVLRHNLRNDMNEILGYADLLQDDGAPVEEYAGQIVSTADQLVSLSEQARELERYARRDRSPERLSAYDVLTGVVAEKRLAFPDATIDVSVETDADVCAGGELRRAMAELVENAVKHNSDPEPWVGVTASRNGDSVRLVVLDDGPGVADVEAAVVDAGVETPLEHGSGLGLWLVNWVVTRYGGSFDVEPREDGGTVASVELPVVGDDDDVAAVARDPTPLFR
jgi:PAS domain S-box-containing protein